MKKMMVALTGLVTLATLGATVPATPITANAAKSTKSTYVSPSLKVNAIYSNAKKVTGTATKGVKIQVKKSKNAKKVLGSATASSKTGKFTVKLAKSLKTNSNVYVYATNTKTKAYFYRIIRVQAAATKAATKKTTTKKSTKKTTKKTTTKKTAAKKTTAKKTVSYGVKTPTGTWKSNTAKKYSQKIVFSQKTGYNQTLYKNGKKVKT